MPPDLESNPSSRSGLKLFGLAGSLRASSSNAALVRAAAALGPPGTKLDLYTEGLATLPPFSPDLDGEGAIPPPEVEDLRARLRAADAVIIASPEYAHGAPGVLKNALDWIVSSGEFEGKPTLLVAASPSGGHHAQRSLTPTLEVIGAKLAANLTLAFTRSHLAADGTVAHTPTLDRLRPAVAALVAAAGVAASRG